MKKMKYFVATLLVGVLALTGCGSKKNSLTAEETAKKVSNSIEKVENYKMNMDFGVKAKVDSEEYNITMAMDADIDSKNKLAKMNIKANAMNEEISMDMYLKFDGNNLVMYLQDPNSKSWVKSTMDISDYNIDLSQPQDVDMTEVLKKLFENENFKQVDPDDNNYNYEMTITSDDIKNMVNEAIQQALTTMGQDAIDDTAKQTIQQIMAIIKGNIKLELSIDKDSFNLSRIKVDVKDFANQTLSSIMALSGASTTLEISRADATIKLSNFGKIDTITIPSEALNAQEVNTGNSVTNFMAF